MFGKFFASAFSGSMYGAGINVFAVWGYIIANTGKDSLVDLNPAMLANTLGCAPDDVVAAIAYLSSPDPGSRSKADEGRRIVREGQFQYRVVNHATYRSIRCDEDRKEYNRLAKQKERERYRQTVSTQPSLTVNESQHIADTDTDTEKEKELPSPSAPVAARPPKPPRKREPKPKPAEAATMDELYLQLQQTLERRHPEEDWPLERAKKAYWAIMGNWDRTKNPAPKQTLKALVAAVEKGDIQWIYRASVEYHREFEGDRKNPDRFQYQKAPLVWLQEEGWTAFPECVEVS